MRQQLLGYLLGALDAPEQERVEEQLQQDPQLREQLEELNASLEPLREPQPLPDPPEGLAQRTCQFVQWEIEQRQTKLAAAAAGGGCRRWSLADMVVAGGVIAATALLFFPAIANSRFESGRIGCQDNLRSLHVALLQYAEANHGFLPAVPPAGDLSFAGLYGPLLHHGGYASNPQLFLCPAAHESDEVEQFDMPTLRELCARQGRALARLQRRAGGSYGYTLGVIINGKHYGVRQQGRAHFAVMADAPSAHLAGRQSDNHGGQGQNVLYEDGHVAYLLTCESGCDHLFLSDRNLVEAGRHRDDVVLGHSTASPILYNVGLTAGRR